MSNEIAKVPGNKPLASIDESDFKALRSLADDPKARYNITTNFDGRGMAAATFITQSLAKPGLRFDDLGGNVFHCKYYLAHVAEVVTQSGEVIATPRLVLLGPDGEVMAGVSEGAVASLDLIRSLCGDGPWVPPLPISVVVVRTRSGFRTFRLVVGEVNHATREGMVRGGGGESTGQVSDNPTPQAGGRKKGV